MTVDTNKLDTSTQGQPHLAKQCLEGLDVNKRTPLSPEVSVHKGRLQKKKKGIIITFEGEGGVSGGHLSLFFSLSRNDF